MNPFQPYNLPDIEIINSPLPLAVYVWIPDKTYLILGQSNKAETSLNMEAVMADNIDVFKRPSGGETVILTPEMLVIGISFAVDSLKNPKQYFLQINNRIIDCLSRQSIKNLSQKGISDIAISEKKILGSSIYRRPGRVFYHAVLNVSEDISIISKYILHPAKEPDYRKGRPHSDFVTSIKESGNDLTVEKLLPLFNDDLQQLVIE